MLFSHARVMVIGVSSDLNIMPVVFWAWNYNAFLKLRQT